MLLAIPPHPHVPLVRDDFFDGDQYVIAMDWVEGTDLGRLLHARGRPGTRPVGRAPVACRRGVRAHPPPRAAPAGGPRRREAGQPRAHRQRPSGARRLRACRRRRRSVRRRTGTRGYAAPELVASGEPSRASDVYSLAATAFTLADRRAADRGATDLGGHRPGAGGRARGGDPPRTGHQPGQASRVGRRAGRAAARRLARVAARPACSRSASRTSWAPPSKWETRAGRHVAVARGARRPRGRGGRAARRPLPRGPGRGRLDGHDVSGARRGGERRHRRRQRAGAPRRGRAASRSRSASGIHTGETDRRRDDYVGPTLNMAARLRGLGEAGEIMVSQVTAGLVERHLPDGVSSCRSVRTGLRGVQEPEEVFAVAAPGVHTPPPPTECPYPGLLSFTADDADRFFGREEVVDDIVDPARAPTRSSRWSAPRAAASPRVLRAGVAPRLGIARSSRLARSRSPRSRRSTGPGHRPVRGAVHPGRERRRARRRSSTGCWPGRTRSAIGLRADFYGACARARRSRPTAVAQPPGAARPDVARASSGGPSPSRRHARG